MPGFLPTRGSLMLDVVVLAMIVIVCLLGLSIALAKRGRFAGHKRLQIGISTLLLFTVLAFEVEMRFLTNWREFAEPSRFYETGIVDASLGFHLLFAIPTPFVWGFVLIQALRHFKTPLQPTKYSHAHKRGGWIAVGMMTMTAVTGWTFYVISFVC